MQFSVRHSFRLSRHEKSLIRQVSNSKWGQSNQIWYAIDRVNRVNINYVDDLIFVCLSLISEQRKFSMTLFESMRVYMQFKVDCGLIVSYLSRFLARI